MAANVLNSKRAIRTSVEVVRAFVRLREMLASHAELRRKLEDLEQKYDPPILGGLSSHPRIDGAAGLGGQGTPGLSTEKG